MVDISHGSTLGGSGASELFQLLRDGSPRTRAELAATTGLARSTIALRVEELMSLGLVSPVGDAQSTGGRPSSQFALNPAAKFVLAADLGATHATIAVTNLSGTIVGEVSEPIEIADGPAKVLDWMIAAGRALFEQHGLAFVDLIAVGIGLPGPVEHDSGRPINPPIMPGWDQFDVVGHVSRQLGVPVLVDNDVNIMALGEQSFAWPQTDNLLFVKVATGIGAGVISGGRLLRGAQGIAGDIGHVRIARGDGVACHCGNQGCLEAMASGPAIAQSLAADGLGDGTAASVVELVRHGNIDAIQAVRQAGRDLGEVLTACVSLMNPSVIAVGGSMAAVGDHLIAGVREIIYTRSMPLATSKLTIAQSAAGADAAVMGASILAIHHALSPEGIDRMSL
jgi:predicted NBD/HSP70 family sugar kinase